MAASVTTFVATTASGRMCRGNLICFTSVGCANRLEHDICTADWKKTQVTSPERTKRDSVDRKKRFQEHREDERVDPHQHERVDERPEEPEDGAAVSPAQSRWKMLRNTSG